MDYSTVGLVGLVFAILLVVCVVRIFTLKEELKGYEKYKPIVDIKAELDKLGNELATLRNDYAQKRACYDKLLNEVAVYEGKVETFSIGLAAPEFQFDDPEDYKVAILDVRNEQRDMVKDKTAIACHAEWKVNGSVREGEKLIREKMKLTLRAFNNECDVIIGGVNWKNYQASMQKIDLSYDFFNKYNASSSIDISPEYLKLKKKELRLAYEHQERKQKIKDEQRALREQMREEEKFEKERIAAEKEEEKYQRLLEKAQAEAAKATGGKVDALNGEIEKLSALLREAQEKNQRALSMAQQTKAGHVYIISNIGSFGDDVFKIGMTRRLEPLDRIRELGDASVPFEFDVHALIASSDAPALEGKLHAAFEPCRMNLVNTRREFFRVSLDRIEKEVKKDSPDAEFVRTALAEQYRKSEAMREKSARQTKSKQTLSEFPDSL